MAVYRDGPRGTVIACCVECENVPVSIGRNKDEASNRAYALSQDSVNSPNVRRDSGEYYCAKCARKRTS